MTALPEDPEGNGFSMFEIVMGLSGAVDFVDTALVGHHARVACLAHSMAKEIGLPIADQRDLVWASLLHDIGAFSLKERLEFLRFEVDNWQSHSEVGYRLVSDFDPLRRSAELIRYHHAPWDGGRGREIKGEEVPLGSHILHLADRVAVTMGQEGEILAQVERILDKIETRGGRLFVPELVDAFKSLCDREVFWLDASYQPLSAVLRERCGSATVELDMAQLTSLAELFCRIIDFRSRFTATHSHGVASVAERLAHLAGFTERERGLMKIAGYLHDLGKLAVPQELLDKPGNLNPSDWHVMKKHPYITYRIIGSIRGLETAAAWAAFHHEQPNGKGYPFHLKGNDLPQGAKILAVADVFTALAEDRPYRAAICLERGLQALLSMAAGNRLDRDTVALLCDNAEEIDEVRRSAQKAVIREYKELSSDDCSDGYIT